ncbi:MAG TPA: transglycosylase SLT domain-containing protein [Pseudonocardiaceae bacterium]
MPDVGSLPGGARLVELIERLTADDGTITTIGQRWRRAGSTAESAGRALTSMLSGVDAGWQGQASDAFVDYLGGFVRLCDGTNAQLGAAAAVLDDAAALLSVARRTMVDRCDALVAEAATARARMPAGTTDQEIDAALAALVDQVYAELVPVVAGADARLAALAGRLGAPGGAGFAGHPEPYTAGPYTAGPYTEGSVPQPGGPTGTGGHHGGGASAGGFGGSGASGSGASGPPPPGGGPAPHGQVADWIRQAIEILKAYGYPVDKMNPADIWLIIQYESAGDPTALNNWDSNAARGTPSKGLMQTIDPTFNAHALPGHTDIYNPVDNIVAGVRYAIDRYGSVSNVPGVVGVKTGAGYRGY